LSISVLVQFALAPKAQVEEQAMAVFQRGKVWWYKFYFAGREIKESSKSRSKTVAKEAEKQRRRELEEGFHNLTQAREQRIRPLKEIIEDYLVGYGLRNRAPRFANYALGHVRRLLGSRLTVDVDAAAVMKYQEDRLREGAAPKSINEEVRFLLKMLGDPGEIVRAQLRKEKQLKLKVRTRIGKAFDTVETSSLSAQVAKSRSPHIYMAFTLARNAGLRDTEIKTLTWAQINLTGRYLTVGRAKTEAGEGRTIPFNDELYEAFVQHQAQYKAKFGSIQPEWYVFPFGRTRSSDPTRHVTTLKTAWNTVRRNAKVTGRWHDNRHTLITELAESGAGDESIMQIAGHVSRSMLRHYSHIRMSAKRAALDAALAARKK
jgi:integrase